MSRDLISTTGSPTIMNKRPKSCLRLNEHHPAKIGIKSVTNITNSDFNMCPSNFNSSKNLLDEVSNKDSIRKRVRNMNSRPMTTQTSVDRKRVAGLNQSKDYYQISEGQKASTYNFISEWQEYTKSCNTDGINLRPYIRKKLKKKYLE
jgi:hypothetical protein